MNKEIKNIKPIANEVIQLIKQSRQNAALAINAEIMLLYWSVGKRINGEILGNERAEYGKQIIKELSDQLVLEYGKGWGEKQLRRCMQFALIFPDERIVSALRRQLSWTHIRSFPKHILIVVFFVLSFSFGQLLGKDLVIIDEYKPLNTISYLTEKFEHCFIDNDTNSLNRFFVEWNKTVLPNADTFINQNDTIATVYNIYKAFYNPFDIKNLGDGKWGYQSNPKCKYILIQNKLEFLVADTDTFGFFDIYQKPDYEKKNFTTISNFRPPIKFDNYKNLYFSSEYDSSLNGLYNQFEKIDQNDHQKHKSLYYEIKKRCSILDKIFSIDWYLGGINSKLETPPYIQSIYLSRDLTKAKIYFSIANCCGEALMTKNDNDWKITKSILTIVW